MFTGIITALGTIADIENTEKGKRISIQTPDKFLQSSAVGDSIAVNGVCLTATDITMNRFAADVSGETLQCTTLDRRDLNDVVNLETSLTLSNLIGGHLVSGHVDGIGEVTGIEQDGESIRLQIQAPEQLVRYIAKKGSICVDGISLTVNQIEDSAFFVNVIPHTIQNTVIRNYVSGTRVNLEVDLIARYIERLMSCANR